MFQRSERLVVNFADIVAFAHVYVFPIDNTSMKTVRLGQSHLTLNVYKTECKVDCFSLTFDFSQNRNQSVDKSMQIEIIHIF